MLESGILGRLVAAVGSTDTSIPSSFAASETPSINPATWGEQVTSLMIMAISGRRPKACPAPRA
jgi:hypothetical protein